MSHIDAALKRAREQADALPTKTGRPGQAGSSSDLPTAEVFRSPWEFQAQDESPARTGGNGAAAPAVTAAATEELAASGNSDQAKGLVRGDPVVAERLAATGQMAPWFFEQYRRLAATLHQAQVEKSIRVVMVTSAVAGEGKTLSAANIALTLAESYGRNTLLVDADLRRPALHDLFAVPNVSGLSDGLRAGSEQRLSLQRLSPRLSMLTAGRPDQDPASLLTSDSMRRVIEEAAAAFDWVLIDTPPVGLLADAKLLAAMVDSVLFVVHAGVTPYDVIKRGIDAIGRDRVIGVVLNRVEGGGRLGHHKYYHYYYGREGKGRVGD